MSTELLSIGPVSSLLQNVVYALPVKGNKIFSSQSLETSNNTAFTTNGTVSANVVTSIASAFVRNTNSTTALVTIQST